MSLMDDAFAERLRSEINQLEPYFRTEVQGIARAVLRRPADRQQPFAKALAMLLKPMVDRDHPAEMDGTITFIRQLPKADQRYIERLIARLHKHLFDAVVAAAPDDLRAVLEEVRIR